jgi:hypothetical protein
MLSGYRSRAPPAPTTDETAAAHPGQQLPHYMISQETKQEQIEQNGSDKGHLFILDQGTRSRQLRGLRTRPRHQLCISLNATHSFPTRQQFVRDDTA